ncbi:50S ribosomal protein L10 [Candidatus Bipolaricaulota bacterium]|nr:50S ribosomal protein L10 [Candidatus Bipolaricaulota bacterium]
MPTKAKQERVAFIKEKFKQTDSLVLVDYRGLNANEMVEMRQRFSKEGLEFYVVKNSLTRIAAKEAGVKEIADHIAGPTGIAFGCDGSTLVFRICEEYRKKYSPRYVPTAGVYEREFFGSDQISYYAALPSREELLANLANRLSGPIRMLAMMLQAKIRELAVVLRKVGSVKEQSNNG